MSQPESSASAQSVAAASGPHASHAAIDAGQAATAAAGGVATTRPVDPPVSARTRAALSAVLPPADFDVSIIVPVYNERENLAPLVSEIEAALATMPGVTGEIVMVDDGSKDGSKDMLRELAAQKPGFIRVIELRRNYGQTAALDAGLRHATGRVLIPMDADRQNDPADIPRLLAEIAKGADVVSGWRKARKDPFFSRKLPSKLANWMIARLTRVPIHDFGCTLKAYRREVLAGVRLLGEMHRFIPAYATWHGAKVIELVVNHRARVWGRSKYGIKRTLKVVLDLLTVMFLQGRYATKPLHIFGFGGMGLMLIAVLLAAFVLFQKFEFPETDPRHIFVHRNPLFTLGAMCGILGVGAIALGLLAELLTRIYHATAGEPYTIAGWRNFEGLPSPEFGRSLSPSLAALKELPPSDPVSR